MSSVTEKLGSSSLVTVAALVIGSAASGCVEPVYVEPRDSTSSALDRPVPPDSDKDGAIDTEDCDPQSSNFGARLVEDDLATANGVIAAAPGFSQTAWEHSGGAWRQLLARNSGDASLFTGALQGGVSVEVTTAITKTDGEVLYPFRQDLVLVGARADAAGDFSAYGCGIELIDDIAKTSIVKLTGDATGIRTTGIKREERDFVEVGAALDITVRADANRITCTVSQGSSTTTLVARDLGAIDGAAGFYTRQVAASFKAVRICKSKG